MQAQGLTIDLSQNVEEVDNGARFYLAAIRLFPIDKATEDRLPMVGHSNWPLFGEGFSDEQSQFVSQAISRRQAAYNLIDQAQRYTQFDYRINAYDEVGHAMQVLGDCRTLARWIVLRGYYAQANDDSETAIHAIQCLLHLSNSLRFESDSTSRLIQISLDAMAVEHAEKALSRLTLSAEQLDKLSNIFQAHLDQADFPNSMRGDFLIAGQLLVDPDLAIAQSELAAKKQSQMLAKAYSNLSTDGWGTIHIPKPGLLERLSEKSLGTFLTWCPGWFQLESAEQLQDLLDLYVELSAPATTPERLKTLTDYKRNRDEPPDLLAGHVLALRIAMQSETTIRVLLSALRVERFRVQHDRWPQTLQEVSDPTPVDAYGQSLRFASMPSGVRIYSIGKNAIDEAHERMSIFSPTRYGEDDWSIRLLNPSNRNRPATVTELDVEETDPWDAPENTSTGDN